MALIIKLQKSYEEELQDNIKTLSVGQSNLYTHIRDGASNFNHDVLYLTQRE